jgi:phage terminase large subunit
LVRQKGRNEFWRLYGNAKQDPAWFHMMLKASESGIIAPSELADLQREMGEDQYQQEFECSFEAAIKGAFYAEEMRVMLAEGRICPIEIAGSTGRCNTGVKSLCWGFECQGLPWPFV